MQPLKPLPLPNQPIVDSSRQPRALVNQPTFMPSQPYAEYFRSVDTVLRALLAPVPNTQTASYVLRLSDLAGTVETNEAGANTLTVPPNAATPFPIGTALKIAQIGAGQTTLTPGAGVTLRSRIGLKSAGQYAVFYLYKRAADEWVASGDLTP
jgi:hypothetical protein